VDSKHKNALEAHSRDIIIITTSRLYQQNSYKKKGIVILLILAIRRITRRIRHRILIKPIYVVIKRIVILSH